MILSIKERIGAILMTKSLSSDLDNQAIVRSIINKCEIYAPEAAIIGFHRVDGDFDWDKSKEKPAEINFSEDEILLLKNTFKFLNENKLINQATFDICLKINVI